MSNRKGIKKDDMTKLLTQCRRRCCLCYCLESDMNVKRGQIAHIDKDPSKSELKNLVWLCLAHHDEYDSKTSQSKGFTREEIILYKEKLELVYADEKPISSEVDTEIKQTGGSIDTISRAEVIQMAIIAIDGLSGYERPPSPTFDDVPENKWYYDFVESAVQLGITCGYTNRDGNLTGLFGPEDIAKRDWATKIIVNSFAIPTTLTPSPPFTDITSNEQYYDYITTAYNQSVIDGENNNIFQPDTPLTRALMAKWMANAQYPVSRYC